MTALRQAVVTGPETYEFLAKAAELFNRLHKQSPPPGISRACRVAYLSNHTVLFHLPILRVLAWSEGLALEIYTSPYGAAHPRSDEADRRVVCVLARYRSVRRPLARLRIFPR